MASVAQKVIWSPQPGPQTALIECPVFEVFYGGARGGGKTEGSIGDWMEHSAACGAKANGIFFRRVARQLEEVVARTHELFPSLGAKYNEQKSTWTMRNGSRLKFRYIERDRDAQEYQGHSYTRVYVEEVTNFPSPGPINLLRATARSAEGLPVGIRLTGNPGGPGHNWVKARYITPEKRGWKIIRELVKGFAGVPDQEMERVFIPSGLADNQLLVRNDPGYVGRLRQSGSEQLVSAWLTGNWDIVDGAFFDQWEEGTHVLPAGEWLPRIPPSALKFRSMDWGYAKPFCVGWYAVSDGTWGLPVGALVKYREWYGSDGRPNVGLRLDAPEVARGVLVRERNHGESMAYGVCDPSMFVRDGGPSIAEQMILAGCVWRRADNKRIPGWNAVRDRLNHADGRRPALYVLDCCEDMIRTFPGLQHDETNAEDMDTEGEDHVADEVRYACMSRPWVAKHAVPEKMKYPQLPHERTIDEWVARARQRRINEENYV